MKKIIKITIIVLAITLTGCYGKYANRILYDKNGNAFHISKGNWTISGYQYSIDSLGKIK